MDYIVIAFCGLIGGISVALVFWLSNSERVADSVEQTIDSGLSPDDLMVAYQRTQRTLAVLAVGAFLFTVGFAATYFTGADIDSFRTLSTEKWIAFGAGVVIVLGVTMFQYTHYQSTASLPGAAWAVFAILIFIYFSEISTSTERNDVLMRHRSENSKTVNVAERIAGIMAGKTGEQKYTDKIADARADAARHQAEFGYCEKKYGHRGQLRILKCQEYEQRKIDKFTAKADAYEQAQRAQQGSYAGAASAAIGEVDKYSRNSEYHLAVIRWISDTFSITVLQASILLAFIFVNAFEVALHATGVQAAILKTSLSRVGVSLHEGAVARLRGRRQLKVMDDAERNTRGRKKKQHKLAQNFGRAQPVRAARPVAATATAQTRQQPVKAEVQPKPASVQAGPTIGFTATLPDKPRGKKKPARAGVLKAADQLDVPAMVAAYQAVKAAKSGDSVACPVCGEAFIKKGLKTFCTNSRNTHGDGSNCSDVYHNSVGRK